jgi:hypothetical protein
LYADVRDRIPAPRSGQARVYFLNVSARGSAPVKMELDGEPVGLVRGNGFFWADVPGGKHTVKGLGGGLGKDNELSIKLASGETAYVHVQALRAFFGTSAQLRLLHPGSGEQMLQNCAYVGNQDLDLD